MVSAMGGTIKITIEESQAQKANTENAMKAQGEVPLGISGKGKSCPRSNGEASFLAVIHGLTR